MGKGHMGKGYMGKGWGRGGKGMYGEGIYGKGVAKGMGCIGQGYYCYVLAGAFCITCASQ